MDEQHGTAGDDADDLLRRALIDPEASVAVAMKVGGLALTEALTIVFHGRADLDVAEHGCGHWRAFCGEHAARALEEWTVRRKAFGGCDRAAFVEHAEQKVLAPGRR